MRQLLNVILISFFLISCTPKPQLVETKWECKVGEGCIDNIFFETDSSLSMYDCEVGEIVYGRYLLKNDTIFIHTLRGQYDHEFKKGSRHRHKPGSFYLLLKDERIYTPGLPEMKYIRTK